MAISQGKQSTEAKEFTRFIGVVPVSILAVNPTAKDLEVLTGTKPEEPNYLFNKEIDGKPVKVARISIKLKPQPLDQSMEIPNLTLTIFLQQSLIYNTTKTKVKIIDKYGRTGWVTIDEAKNKIVPNDKNGNPLNLDRDYRTTLVGEEDITKFIKAFLCIPNPTIYDRDNKHWVANPNVKPEDCECRLTMEDLSNILSGNFTAIQEALAYQPDNKVKVMVGVRTDPNTQRIYQDVYNKEFIQNSNTTHTVFQKEITAMIDRAALRNVPLATIYSADHIHEYVAPSSITPTALSYEVPETPKTVEEEQLPPVPEEITLDLPF